MDPFVRRLVERLFDPNSGLSRNRHFHTFDNPEGRAALRLSKRLLALANDITACHQRGGRPAVSRSTDAMGIVQVEISIEHLRSRRTTNLVTAEYELLMLLPGVAAALQAT
jgi:hypothetical protein